MAPVKLTITLTPPAARRLPPGEKEHAFVLLGVAKGWTITIGKETKDPGLHPVLKEVGSKVVKFTCSDASASRERHSLFWFVSGQPGKSYTIDLKGPIRGFNEDPSGTKSGDAWIRKTLAQGESLGAGHRYFWF